MNEKYGLTKENLLSAFPSVLRNDPDMEAIADSVSDQLVAQDKAIDSIRIYTMIDSLPEDLCDILAKDLSIGWYDFDYSLEEKRRVIRKSFEVHRHLGTVGAVKSAVSAVYEGTDVSEWFDYKGEPYHFKLLVDATYQNIDPEKHARLLQKMELYKNLRSVLDEVEYRDLGTDVIEYWFAGYLGEEITDEGTAFSY